MDRSQWEPRRLVNSHIRIRLLDFYITAATKMNGYPHMGCPQQTPVQSLNASWIVFRSFHSGQISSLLKLKKSAWKSVLDLYGNRKNNGRTGGDSWRPYLYGPIDNRRGKTDEKIIAGLANNKCLRWWTQCFGTPRTSTALPDRGFSPNMFQTRRTVQASIKQTLLWIWMWAMRLSEGE